MLFEVLLNLDSFNEELKSRIYEILNEDAEDLNKIFRILFLQFSYRQSIFSAEEVVSFICLSGGRDCLEDFETIEVLNFEVLLKYAVSNLISFAGIDEYCESCASERVASYAEAIKKSLVIDPIKLVRNVYELRGFYASSDVLRKIETARRYMKSYMTLLRKAKSVDGGISYVEWKEKAKEWEFLRGELLLEEEKEEIERFERDWKFKWSKKGKKLYRELRGKVERGEKIKFFEVMSLKNEVGEYYFRACCSKLWRGFEKEFNKINEIADEEKRVEKLLAIMSKV